jgi:hypothetical protein
METYYREQLRLRTARAAQAPKELRELAARIIRLRERLERGDPDLTSDEQWGRSSARRASAESGSYPEFT